MSSQDCVDHMHKRHLWCFNDGYMGRTEGAENENTKHIQLIIIYNKNILFRNMGGHRYHQK